MKKIKILRLITRLNVGGPAQHVIWLTGRLDSDQFETLLVVGKVEDNEKDMDYFAEREGVRFLCIPEMRRKISFNDFLAIIKIYKVIDDFKPDIIHTHTSKAGFLGGLAGIIYNIRRFLGKKDPVPIVHTFHGHTFQNYFSPRRERIFRHVERFLSYFPLGRQVILTLTPGQREDIQLLLNNKMDNKYSARSIPEMRVLPLGIDLEPFINISKLRGNFRKEFGIPAETLIVGWVGRLTTVKNPSLFLEAAGICKNKCSQPVCYVIAGEGELESIIQRQIDSLGISDSVLILGNRRDMCSLLVDMDILVSTSHNEGTPVSMLEAMFCQVPVVATDVGGVREIICQDWKQTSQSWNTISSQQPRGVLVSPQNADKLAVALEKLINNPSYRLSLATPGPGFVKKVFPLKRLISDIEAMYRQICRFTK